MRRDRVIDTLADAGRALHSQEIATRLGVEPGAYPALQRVLDDLSFDGSIVPLAGQKFRLNRHQAEARSTEIQGVLSVHARGFGFVAAPGPDGDLFIPAEAIAGGMHGDTVRARLVTRSRRGLEGEVVSVVTRRAVRVSGVLRKRGKSAWLEPDDSRIRGPIVLGRTAEGRDGDAAVVQIKRYPEMPGENPEGELLAALGEPGAPDVEAAKILLREGIEEAHPPEAVAEAEAFGGEVPAGALDGRIDLTHLPLPTIDPEDARDHDDAVWAVRSESGGYTAWIAIADVSSYVRPGTALDAAALARGTSIYLPDRAIPMLPSALSSNLCSLIPGALRLCLAIEVALDPTGAVVEARLMEAVMRSRAGLTYPGVARALDLTTAVERDPAADAMKDELRVLLDLAMLLRARRLRRGALDLEVPEARIKLDPETNAPIDVEKRSRDPGVAKAYQLIEELMLLANEQVAAWLLERNVPTIFRNHGAPDETKLARFAAACEVIDVAFEADDALDPRKLARFLKRIAKHPKKQVLHGLLLRSMRQALYEADNKGHFGLASPAYLHFTSPIRRYPDLVVHRAVRALLHGEPVDTSERALEDLRKAASTASERERKAMDIEREVADLYRAIVMRSHIGEIIAGTVTAFVASGAFVSLDKPFVDVLVRSEALGSEYVIDDSGLFAAAARSGARISLGDTMRVLIEDVSVERRTVYARRVRPEEMPERDGQGDEVVFDMEVEAEALASDPSSEKARRRVKRTGTTAPAKAKGTERAPSRKERPAPRTEGAASRKERPAPRPERAPSRKERPAPRTEGAASRKERTTPRTEGAPSRKERTTPRTEGAPSRKERSSPQKDRPTSKPKARLIKKSTKARKK